MARTVPTPLAAAVGLLPAFVDGVRSLPGKAIHVPFIALSGTLAAVGTIRREYDDLADRGDHLIAKLRGVSLDEVEDQLEDLVEGTPLAAAYDRVEDAVEDAVDTTRDVFTERAGKLRAVVTDLAPSTPASSTPAKVASAPAAPKPAAQRPKGVPTPKASEPDSTRIDTAASQATVTAVEKVVQKSQAQAQPAELPLPDYDHMTLGSLRGRLRSLDVDQLVALRAYEKAHADRLPVVTMLDNRIAKLASEGASGAGSTS